MKSEAQDHTPLVTTAEIINAPSKMEQHQKNSNSVRLLIHLDNHTKSNGTNGLIYKTQDRSSPLAQWDLYPLHSLIWNTSLMYSPHWCLTFVVHCSAGPPYRLKQQNEWISQSHQALMDLFKWAPLSTEGQLVRWRGATSVKMNEQRETDRERREMNSTSECERVCTKQPPPQKVQGGHV